MSDEAKLILSAYRPGGQDAGDPAFATALAAAQQDTALARWLAEHQEFDTLMAAHLRAVAVPADLRARIIAGGAASRARPRRAGARWWALAAVVAILATFAGLLVKKDAGLADWQRRGLAVLEDLEARRSKFDFEHRDAAVLAAWLGDHEVPQPGSLPPALSNRRTYGCKTIAWDGHKMSLICFDLGGDVVAHLFTTDRAGLTRVPPDGPPRIVRHGAWTVALWNDGPKTHMLATDGGAEPLRRVLRIAEAHGSPGPAPALAAILR